MSHPVLNLQLSNDKEIMGLSDIWGVGHLGFRTFRAVGDLGCRRFGGVGDLVVGDMGGSRIEHCGFDIANVQKGPGGHFTYVFLAIPRLRNEGIAYIIRIV